MTLIYQDGDEVVLSYTTWNGAEVERRFWVPSSGGVVREVNNTRERGDYRFVCRGLGYLGATLEAKPDNLLPLIEAEWDKVSHSMLFAS